jgi:hypothetical protein
MEVHAYFDCGTNNGVFISIDKISRKSIIMNKKDSTAGAIDIKTKQIMKINGM